MNEIIHRDLNKVVDVQPQTDNHVDVKRLAQEKLRDKVTKAVHADLREIIDVEELGTALELTQETATDRERDLMDSWNGNVMRLTDNRYLMEKQTSDGLEVVMVSGLNDEVTAQAQATQDDARSVFHKKSWRTSVYSVEKMAFRAEGGKWVDMMELIPETVGDLQMRVRENDNRLRNDQRQRRMSYRGGTEDGGSRIEFDGIRNKKDALDLAGHEVGHAEFESAMSSAQVERYEQAAHLASEASIPLEVSNYNTLRKLESDYGISLPEAMKLFADHERAANDWERMMAAELGKMGVIEEQDVDIIVAHTETLAKGYDYSRGSGRVMSVLFEGAQVSDEMRHLVQGRQAELTDHYNTVMEIDFLLQDERFRGRDKVILHDEQGTITCGRYSNSIMARMTDGEETASMQINLPYARLTGETGEVVFDLNNETTAAASIGTLSEIRKGESRLLKALQGQVTAKIN